MLDDLISEQGLSKKKAGAAWLASLHAFVEKHSAQLPAGGDAGPGAAPATTMLRDLDPAHRLAHGTLALVGGDRGRERADRGGAGEEPVRGLMLGGVRTRACPGLAVPAGKAAASPPRFLRAAAGRAGNASMDGRNP